MNQTSGGLPVYEFILDSAADVNTLQTMDDKKGFVECVAAGSFATVKDLSALFMLSANGWAEV